MSRLIPGTPVVWKNQTWILLDIPAIDRVLLRDPASGSTELAPAKELKSVQAGATGSHGLVSISDTEWEEAWRRFDGIRPLLDRSARKRTREEIDEVAKNLGRDPATIYRWIARWSKTKTVSSLVRSGRSDYGRSRLPQAVEGIIKNKIESFYLVPERPTVVELSEEVALECRKSGVKPPNTATVRRRVERLQDRLVVSKRHKEAREQFEPIRGSFPGAEVPLAVYQIDHSPVDVIFVDETYRRPIGRGYLTIVSDSCTRVLAGFCVSLDPPGALATGLALAHAILPKGQWLAAREINAEWPVEGIPAKVFADNAAEFRGTMLERACREYNIVMENRPKGLPNYGGHIERLFRTFMHRAQSLPGTTFSNTLERGEYDSDRKAVMTLREFEKWFTTFVTMVYHQRPHKGIGRIPPIKLHEQFIVGSDSTKGIGLPEPVADEYKLRLDFLPFQQRTIQEYGVVMDNIHYYADVLRPWIHGRDPDNAKLKRKFIFARDPRDISEVYFLDPETQRYYPVPYRELTRKPMSLWDLNAIQKKIAENPALRVDEDTIFSGLEEMKRIEKDSAEKSRSVRRSKQRRADWVKGSASSKPPPAPVSEALDWGEEIQPFDDIEESL